MKSGYEIRKVINKLNEFNFDVSKDREIFGEFAKQFYQNLEMPEIKVNIIHPDQLLN